jgi:predicted MFS family arabinose efflux permease
LDGDSQRLWNRQFIFLLSLSAVTATAFNMVTPALPLFAVELGAGLTIAGTLAGIFAITALVVRPFSGAAVDRLNKKRLLVVSTALMALAVMGYSQSRSVAVLFLFRILHGAAFSVSGTTNTSLACAYIPPRRLGEGVGYLGLGFILATAIGPSLGLGLAERYGYQVTFTASAVLFALAAGLMLLLPYRHQPAAALSPEEGSTGRLRLGDLFARDLLIYAALAAIVSLSNGVVATFVSLFAQERGIPNIGLFFTVSAVSMLAMRLVGGRLLDRYGLSRVLYPAYAVAGLSMLLLAASRTLPPVLVASMLRSLGQSAAQPALQATCIRKLGPARTGVATSTFFVGADVGQGLGPIIGGAVSETMGYSAMYAGTGVVLMLGMVLYAWYERRQRARQSEAPAS